MLADAPEHRRSGWIFNTGAGADATVMVGMGQGERGLRKPKYIYSGTTGAFLAQKPGLGTAPSTGGVVSDHRKLLTTRQCRLLALAAAAPGLLLMLSGWWSAAAMDKAEV